MSFRRVERSSAIVKISKVILEIRLTSAQCVFRIWQKVGHVKRSGAELGCSRFLVMGWAQLAPAKNRGKIKKIVFCTFLTAAAGSNIAECLALSYEV